MIKIPEIITILPVWHTEFRKWGIMVRNSKIRPMRYELSKWSNKFHAPKTERRQRMSEYESRSSSWMQKRHKNMVLHSLIRFSSWYDISLSLSLFTCVVYNYEANNNIDCIVVHAKELLLSLYKFTIHIFRDFRQNVKKKSFCNHSTLYTRTQMIGKFISFLCACSSTNFWSSSVPMLLPINCCLLVIVVCMTAVESQRINFVIFSACH